jgi:phage terminase small subunit
MSLNERQQKFCEFYAKSGNATEAYRSAGYKVKNETAATVSASRLLTNDNIKAEIVNLGAKTRTEAIASISEIQEMWSDIARSTEEETPHRIKAGELLVKVQGGFLERIEHSGTTVQRVININPTKKDKK